MRFMLIAQHRVEPDRHRGAVAGRCARRELAVAAGAEAARARCADERDVTVEARGEALTARGPIVTPFEADEDALGALAAPPHHACGDPEREDRRAEREDERPVEQPGHADAHAGASLHRSAPRHEWENGAHNPLAVRAHRC